ncbi:heme o synthase [Lewinella cohaerens]|uniref:heme o synthase n=1 Tax=Lewinella cohaerens TaxID=70995 RepID=UPI0003613A96|nr:heme o synthase [Lewinella cohaerens]
MKHSISKHKETSLNPVADSVSIDKPFAALRLRIQDLFLLVKFRLSATVVFSSVIAYLIAATGTISFTSLAILAAGGFLTTGAANTLNQVLEKDYDRLMKRTANRPLAAGRMKTSEAVLAAGFMSLFGISLLAVFNPWTAFFGTFALVSYAFVYTPMKRVSPGAVLIGAVPGALPTLIGCVAAQGELTWLGLTLFAIQFCWQFPHFWSIAFLGYEDYSKAGYQLVPEEEGQIDLKKLGQQALGYALVLIPLGILPTYFGYTGWWSAGIVAVLGVFYSYFAWRFLQQPERKTALQLMFFSFGYIPLSLLLFWGDKMI